MAIAFNGSSDYCFVNAAPAGPTNFSASLWFKTSSGIGSNPYPLCIGPLSGPSQDYLALISGNSSWCGSYKTVGGAAQSSASAASDGVWYHLAGYWRSTTRRSVFAHNNGTRSDDTTAVTTDTPGKTVIGAAWYNGAAANYVNGLVAMVGLWSTELSDVEFASLRAGFSPRKIRPQALVAFWPMLRERVNHWGSAASLSDGGAPSVTADMPRIYW